MEDYYLVDAKQEYTSYLISTLAPSMYTGFKDIFEQSKKIVNGNSVFKNFQLLLSNVPNWNDHILNREVLDITKETGCDWLDNLITAVFVSHSKILTSVKIGNYRPKNKKIDLKIPDTNSFIHQCYIQSAREFYKSPLLFLEDTKMIRTDEILKNQKLAHSIIKDSIMTTIRKLLPFRNILNEYLSLENQNNTIFIGNTSMGGSIAQSNLPTITLPPPSEVAKPIESSIVTKPDESLFEEKPQKPVLPIIEDIPLPELNKSKKSIPKKIPLKEIKEVTENDSLSTISSKENEADIKATEPPIAFIEKSISSKFSDEISLEKEMKVVGRELNLFEIEPNEENDNSSLDASKENLEHTKEKKIESLDSASLNKFVNHIKEEFNDKEEKSINLDDLSFLELNKSIQKEEPPILFAKYSEIESSIDIEKIKQALKEDGTIAENSLPSFPLQHITPIKKDIVTDNKSMDKSQLQSKKQEILSNNIKKISIKYNANVPFRTAPRRKPLQKAKTTLVEEAADDDSSEMVFK